MQKLQPKVDSTFEEYFCHIFAPYILRQLRDVEMLDIVWYVYKDDSLKKQREKCVDWIRGRTSCYQHGSFSDWKGFLIVVRNRDELFKLLRTKV